MSMQPTIARQLMINTSPFDNIGDYQKENGQSVLIHCMFGKSNGRNNLALPLKEYTINIINISHCSYKRSFNTLSNVTV